MRRPCGSKDKSGEICDNYSKRHSQIKVFQQKNQSVSAARNTGINNASGEWIMFIDPDDWVETWIFKHLDLLFKEHLSIDLIRCYHNTVNHDGSVSTPKLSDQIKVFKRDDFIKHKLLPGFAFSVIISKQHVLV